MAWSEMGRRAGLIGVGVALSGAALLVGTPAHAEFTKFKWKTQDQPAPRENPGFAFDSSRGRAVLFGGDSNSGSLSDVWEWNGKTWTEGAPFFSPAARNGLSMLFDARAGKIGLFGGAGSSVFADTWLWNGSSWLNAQPSKAPPARLGASVAYDSSRDRWVLFGGRNSSGAVVNDTWEFDSKANTWVSFSPPASPTGRWYAAMAFHKQAGRVILAGGIEDFENFHDTWEWNGQAGTWTRLVESDEGSSLGGAALAYDEKNNVLVEFGGIDNQYRDRTFQFSYADKKWTLRSPTHSPPAFPANAVYDSVQERVLLYQGSASTLWEWDGADWTQRGPGVTPPTRGFSQIAYDSDRKRVLLFGGSFGNPLGDTWEWDGASWHDMQPASSPTPRYACALAYDSTRKNTVMFAGFDSSVPNNETWIWNGTTWALRTPATRPPAVLGAMAAHDSVRGKTVLFGGVALGVGDDGVYGTDTWEWDGTDWAKASPAVSPDARILGPMAFDEVHQNVVMFGGSRSTKFGELLDDTWTYNGVTWTKLSPVHHPSKRYFSKMTYDANRKKVVMFAGVTGAGASNELWQWDGTDWSLIDVEARPVTSGNTVSFSFDGSTLMTFGGTIRVNNASTTLLLVPKTDTCAVDADCANETYCVDGVCCASKSCNGCETCNGLSPGICSPIFNGEDVDTCSFADGKSCGPKGSCQVATGSTCSDGTACASGFCVDGVCCESRCDSACVACSAALKADGSRDGLCGVTKPGVTATETCGTIPTPACFDETHRLSSDGTQGESCGGFRCGAQGCLAGCASVDDCESGYVCDFGGRCVTPPSIDNPSGCAASSPSVAPPWCVALLTILASAAFRRRRVRGRARRA